MQIPDEVRNTALAEFESVAARSSVGPAVTATWQVIAEWARKEALVEAAAVAESDQFWDDRGDVLSSDEVAYNTARSEAGAAVRALAEGVRS